jgi:endonuclease/exonuclease/phosphatase family metal-dependent hydrolase
MSPLPRRTLPWLAALLLAALAAPPAPAQAPARRYLFCFWNVENLFDDKPNPKLEKTDREYDDYFAKDSAALKAKLGRIAEVLLGMNGGRGPDILALAEVESARAAELVRAALNAKLKKEAHYRTVVYRDPKGGRSIATALVTRLPVRADRTVLLGRAQRILKTVVEVDKRPLVVVAAHWTSRVSDAAGRGRVGYADIIYNDFRAAFQANAEVDYLVCGDFNDTPSDRSVAEHLHATGDLKKVLAIGKGGKPLFYNPFADFARDRKGTHAHRDTLYVFDQICLSPGLLDGAGWSYVNRSAAIVEKLQFRGRPDRFGGPRDKRPFKNRGASDHYPVTIELRIHAGK